MRIYIWFLVLLFIAVGWGVRATAQIPSSPAPGKAPSAAPSSEAKPAEAAGTPAAAGEATPPAPPAPPSTEPGPAKEEAAPEAGASLLPSLEPAPSAAGPRPMGEAPEVPSPGEIGDRLARTLPESVKGEEEWTAPQPVLTLHGYYRMRGELQDNFWLGRAQMDDPSRDPFSMFKPLERRQAPSGGCGGESERADHTCDISTLQYANMRLRLGPQLNLSDDVRVKMLFDMFDNMIAGTGPVSYYGSYSTTNNATGGIYASSDEPAGQTIAVRQAWAEVRRRGLGELRFGRMPNHWGMGILNNAGTEIDDDYSSSIDRVMGITKIAGIYLTAAYDFIAEGLGKPNASNGLPTDASQLDDVDQFTFTVARRLSPEEQDSTLEHGNAVLNGGVYFSYRTQNMTASSRQPVPQTQTTTPVQQTQVATPAYTLTHVGAESFTFDWWGQLRWRGLRLELEAAVIAGTMDNIDENASYQRENYDILSLGTALEFEYRLVNDKLGLHFDTGLATGDDEVDGLSSLDDLVTQRGDARRVTTFRFNPSYRVDLILWRSLMRHVTGAYYFKPGINYDFLRNPFGQLFGARLDVIWSRAASVKQTWGDAPDLGVEINASLYWRSEDGPEPIDGFYAKAQWGMLFPLHGLGYTSDEKPQGFRMLFPQTLRLLLGVMY